MSNDTIVTPRELLEWAFEYMGELRATMEWSKDIPGHRYKTAYEQLSEKIDAVRELLEPQPEPVSIEPIPPQIQSQVTEMMRDAGMIEQEREWASPRR